MMPDVHGFPAYVLMWIVGAAVGISVGVRSATRHGFPLLRSAVALCAAALIILIGSKLLFLTEYALVPVDDVVPQGQESVAELLRHGFRIPGGIFLLLIAYPPVCRALRLPVLRFTDVMIPAPALAVFFIRIGCFLNGCCFGRPTSLPIGITFPPGARVYYWQIHEGIIAADAARTVAVYPLQLMFALMGLLIYFLARRWQRTKTYDGEVWLRLNLAFFGGTFLLELLRPYPLHVNLVLTASVVLAMTGISVWARRGLSPRLATAS